MTRSWCIFLLALATMSSCMADEVLGNELVTLSFDGVGRIRSLRECASGRELVREPTPFVSLVDAAGQIHVPISLKKDSDGRLVFVLAHRGEVALSVRQFPGGWSFTVVRCTAHGFTELRLGRVDPACRRWEGELVNAYSDQKSFVCTRIYDEGGGFCCASGSVYCVARPGDLAVEGVRFGMAAGPRASAIPALRAMTLDAGVPHGDKGGAWALGAAACRRSYWMAWGVGPFTVDDEIEMCRRGGFGTLHFDMFFNSYGSYGLPGDGLGRDGMSVLRDMIEQAHEAGLHCDFHSLCACAARNDPLVTPECQDGFMTTAVYALGADLPASTNGTTLVVDEQPVDCHEFELSFWGKGNVLKVGTELMTYSGISAKAPWTFTGLRRGAFGTTVKPHARGEKVEYLFNCYACFQIDADSELAKREWDIQGRLFRAGFDNYYVDGADCIRHGRKTDKFVHGLYRAALANGKAPLYEDSVWAPSTWWFHSRIGANDYVRWGSKRALDRRFMRFVSKARDANFIEPEMGWWAIFRSGEGGSPYRIDEHEYFGRKCAAYDTAMSVLPGDPYPARSMVARNIFGYVTVIGWYERFRLARAFNGETIAKFRGIQDEYRLRQDFDGVWKIRPLEFHHHRAMDANSRMWNVVSKERREATIRIEALVTCNPWNAPDASVLLDPSAAAFFEKSAAEGVAVEFAPSRDAAHGDILTIMATNGTSTSRGAWSCVARTWPAPQPGRSAVYGDCRGSSGLGLWVNGDGSGALLNVQLLAPSEAGTGAKSEHYLKLDFTGWRYVEFSLRERDAGLVQDYVWPYAEESYSIDFGYALERERIKNVKAVNLYLNEVPAGGSAKVSVSAVRLLSERRQTSYSNLAVTLNGALLVCPFVLAATDYAELEGGFWTHYSPNGIALERAPAPVAFLCAGTNKLSFAGNGGEGVNVRADVNILALGESTPALKPMLEVEHREPLSYEAVAPAKWSPAKGFATIPDVVTRPGENATLSFEIHGPISPFTLSVGDETRQFGRRLAHNEYLVCRDGENWKIKRRGVAPCIVDEGRIVPYTPFTGTRRVSLACDEPDRADAFLMLVKHYR